MKPYNKYLIIFLSSILLLLTGCDSFEDINTNPDSPTSVQPSMLATKLIHEMVRKDRYSKEYTEDGVLIKHLTWNENASSLQYNRLERGSLSRLVQLTNCTDMVAKAPGNKGYEGLALFAKSYMIYYTTMEMGDIPYSEAGKGEKGITKPKYDTQKDVILGILGDLEKAYTCFSEADETAFDGDIIFNGNREKWMKTVTALQLKALINLSKKENDADINVKSRFASIVKNSALFESNEDNFQLTYRDQAGMKYPFNDLTTNQTKYAMLSSVIVNMLKERNDYRLFYYGEPSIAKSNEGIASSAYEAYVGVDPSSPFGDVSKAHGANLFCTPNLRYISEKHVAGEPLIRLGYGEQQLILAEAALRGWIGENPSACYNQGIKANMTFIRTCTPDEYAHERTLTDDYIHSYIEGDRIKLTGHFESDLNKIISQKYIAYFLQSAYDAYFDYRRTGYPALPIDPNTSMNVTAPGKIPVRYMYPLDEYSYNRENLEEAINRQFGGSDDINDVMWILQ
jgi:hypothetical protein